MWLITKNLNSTMITATDRIPANPAKYTLKMYILLFRHMRRRHTTGLRRRHLRSKIERVHQKIQSRSQEKILIQTTKHIHVNRGRAKAKKKERKRKK